MPTRLPQSPTMTTAMVINSGEHKPEVITLSNGIRVVFDVDKGHPTAAVGCPLSTSKTTRMPLLSVMTSGLCSPLLITMAVVIVGLWGSLVGIPSNQTLASQRDLAIVLE